MFGLSFAKFVFLHQSSPLRPGIQSSFTVVIYFVLTLFITLRMLLKSCFLFLDENECNLARSPCDLNAICINTNGSFQCECNAGFTGDGFRCGGRPRINEAKEYPLPWVVCLLHFDIGQLILWLFAPCISIVVYS